MPRIKEAAGRIAGVVLVSLGATAVGHAQTYPAKPVRIIVPFPAGSSTDFVARLIGDKLAQKWGQAVVVENKAGAAGNIGSQYVASSPADGYTLLFSTVANAIGVGYMSKPIYDFVKDFAPVTLVATAPLVIVSNPSQPPADIRDLLRLAKNAPGKLTFGSGGNGTSTHFTGEYLNQVASIQIKHIPYKGATAAQVDVVGGRLTILLDNLAGVLPIIQSGRLKALAVTSTQRSPMLPDVPTLQEIGLAGFEALGWQGVNVPAHTPKDIVAKLNRDLVDVIHMPEVRQKIESSGAVAVGNSVDEYTRFVQAEVAKWSKVAQTAGIKEE
ncbi:tripartite tricarboxylate transporter substrate binding protein [Pigmentiphaga sp.]|uniref:tripartite tricarboxylate transporter substrate binding protein n=1 Tax=Pigmentiphaga sp. TaxID=1977564 RepID=UPI0025F81318|nr:tripartite tricarboxylate transporter substrate binding protein [Pigmentiphaga sp.]